MFSLDSKIPRQVFTLYHDSHLRCLPLLTQLSWSPFAVRHKSASSFLAHLRSLYHKNVFSPVHSRTRAIALYRPASHGCSFVNGARKEYVCFAAAFFSSALIISHFVCPFLFFINLHPDFLFSIPIACTQKFSPENITFPKTKSVIFPILKFFYFSSTQIDFFVG